MSLKKLALTADPANDPASVMSKMNEITRKSVGMKAAEGMQNADMANSSDEKNADVRKYRKSRTEREKYNAKLTRLEFEEKASKLVVKA